MTVGANDKQRHVAIVMPREINASAGGITRMLDYFLGAIPPDSKYRFTLCPTRLSERPVIKHLTTVVALAKFLKLMAFGSVDIVHIHVAPNLSTWRKFVFFSFAKIFGKPVVIHLHGSGYDDFYRSQNAAGQFIVQRMFRFADRLIVLGKTWHSFVTSEVGADQSRVEIINNGVPDPQIRGHKSDFIPNIVFVGAIGHRKGVDVLLQAISKIPKSVVWRCTLCGSGDIPKYMGDANILGIDDVVKFKGWLDRVGVLNELSQADIFVLPSRAENQPVAILEAMAMCLPVISTALGDIPNQVLDGVTGYTVEPGDADALSERLTRLLQDQPKRDKFGLAGRQHYEENYSINANVYGIFGCYDKILN